MTSTRHLPPHGSPSVLICLWVSAVQIFIGGKLASTAAADESAFLSQTNIMIPMRDGIKVVLYASSSAPNTDFTAKLVDVHPDGRAYLLCDGIVRASYRNSHLKPEPIEPNRIYKYEIDLWVTSNVYLKGHRARVEISSSNFPRFDRNPNTGHSFGADATLTKATQTIYHDASHPSHILLPVIPR